MAKHSEYTKKAYRRCWILRAIDFAILFGPFIYEVIKAIIAPYTTQQKVVVLGTTAVAFILCMVNLIAQKHLRSPLWIIFLGLYFAVKDLIPLVIWVAVASIIDEFVLTPLIKYYKTKTIANMAMDERLGTGEEVVAE